MWRRRCARGRRGVVDVVGLVWREVHHLSTALGRVVVVVMAMVLVLALVALAGTLQACMGCAGGSLIVAVGSYMASSSGATRNVVHVSLPCSGGECCEVASRLSSQGWCACIAVLALIFRPIITLPITDRAPPCATRTRGYTGITSTCK